MIGTYVVIFLNFLNCINLRIMFVSWKLLETYIQHLEKVKDIFHSIRKIFKFFNGDSLSNTRTKITSQCRTYDILKKQRTVEVIFEKSHFICNNLDCLGWRFLLQRTSSFELSFLSITSASFDRHVLWNTNEVEKSLPNISI